MENALIMKNVKTKLRHVIFKQENLAVVTIINACAANMQRHVARPVLISGAAKLVLHVENLSMLVKVERNVKMIKQHAIMRRKKLAVAMELMDARAASIQSRVVKQELTNGAVKLEQNVENHLIFAIQTRNVKIRKQHAIMKHKKLAVVMELMDAHAANIQKIAVKQEPTNGAVKQEQNVEKVLMYVIVERNVKMEKQPALMMRLVAAMELMDALVVNIVRIVAKLEVINGAVSPGLLVEPAKISVRQEGINVKIKLQNAIRTSRNLVAAILDIVHAVTPLILVVKLVLKKDGVANLELLVEKL